MLATILAAFQAIPAALQLFKGIMGVVKQIQMLFRKSPVEQQAEEEKKHAEAAKKAETEDDTTGTFG